MFLRKKGYLVEETKISQDQGADLILSRFGKKSVVQAKRYRSSVGNDAIQAVVASIKFYGAHEGMVVTNSKFTKAAIELARSNNITLVSGKELKIWMDSI